MYNSSPISLLYCEECASAVPIPCDDFLEKEKSAKGLLTERKFFSPDFGNIGSLFLRRTFFCCVVVCANSVDIVFRVSPIRFSPAKAVTFVCDG